MAREARSGVALPGSPDSSAQRATGAGLVDNDHGGHGVHPPRAQAQAGREALLDAVRTSLRAAAPEWWPVWLGLAVLFLPTFADLFTGAWIGEEQAHGPMIFGLALWLVWRKWPEVRALAAGSSWSGWIAGWLVLAAGLLLHLLGRTQHILMFEIGAIVLVMMAVVLVKHGARALRVLWFPFFFMLFMVPLPSEFVAAVTMPMKMAVSWATEQILFGAGYPVARSGVILQIGQYQLLVADACAGLQTLLTLEALGLFYLNLMRHPSPFRNVGLALLIVPISFSANVIRVIVLTLVTFYMGDAAGQGFLHGFAGMVLFLTALALILAVDSGLQWGARRRTARKGQGR
jgi:exosortase B